MPYTDLDALLPGGSASTGDSVPATYFAGITTNFELVDPWGAWTAYTPTLTNLTLGNGAQIARWMRAGRLVTVNYFLQLGSTSAVGSDPRFSLPVAARATGQQVLTGHYQDTGTRGYAGWASIGIVNYTTALLMQAESGNGNVTASAPHTWATTDTITVSGTYEAAADA